MNTSNRIQRLRTRLQRTLSGVCFALCVSGSVVAHAEPSGGDSERANLLFKKGKAALNEGKYADALRIYTEAWHLKQSPDIAANLAQAETELGKHRDAAEHFAFALGHLLPSSTDEQKKALAEGLEAEKKEVGTLHVTLEPADATLSVDGAAVTLPASGDLFVEPGDHQCVVTREGYEAHTQSVQVSKGASRVLWIRLTAVGASAQPVTPAAAAAPAVTNPPDLPLSHEPHSRSLVPAFVGGGLVVAGATVGVVFLLSASSSQKDADHLKGQLPSDNACGTGSPFAGVCADLHSKNQDVDSARRLEVAGFAVAGVAAVGTAVYLLWPHDNDAAARLLSPTLAWVPGAGSVGVAGRF